MALKRDTRLRGRVKPSRTDAGGRATTVLVMRGQSRLAEGPVSKSGRFEVRIPATRNVVVTILGEDGRVMRRRLTSIRGDGMDLGDLELPVAEFPAGIAGQAWDARDDRPVTGGRAMLRLDEAEIASERLDSNGSFAFELSLQNPMPAGTYHVIVEVPGYRRTDRVVDVTDDVTSYRMGHVEVMPASKD